MSCPATGRPPAGPRPRGGGRDRPGRRGRRDRLVRRRGAGREGRRRAGRAPGGPARPHRFPLGPGFLLDGAPVVLTPPTAAAARAARRRPGGRLPYGVAARAPSRAPGPGSRAARGSASRAATTPSWSRRSGATTCGSRAWWSRCSTASTTSPAAIARLRPGPGPADGRAGRPPGAGHQGGRRGRGRAPPAVRRARQGPRPPVRRRVAVGAARAARASRPGRSSRAGSLEARHRGRARLAAPTQADIARAWKRILGTVRTYADLEPSLLASVEELIDFVTGPGGDRSRLVDWDSALGRGSRMDDQQRTGTAGPARRAGHRPAVRRSPPPQDTPQDTAPPAVRRAGDQPAATARSAPRCRPATARARLRPGHRPVPRWRRRSPPPTPGCGRCWPTRLGGTFLSFLVPLVIFLVFKDRDLFVRRTPRPR